MCLPVVMASVAVAGAVSGQRDASKAMGAQIAAQNASKMNTVRSLNYDLVARSQEQRDEYDNAVAQLQGNSINAIRNQGMIEAAFGESGLEGRSVDAALRDVRGQDARVADSVRGSFRNSFAGKEYNKEVAVLNADASIKGMPQIRGPSTMSNVLGVVNAGLSGAAVGANMSGMAAKAGGWTNLVKGGK